MNKNLKKLYKEAQALVMKENNASISFVQRKLIIGYNTASILVLELEKNKVVSTADKHGARNVLY